MRKAGRESFEKRVEIVAKQADEQLVTGVVMRPDEVDLQHDYATPEQVADFAGQFEALYEEGDADGGVMHTAFPSEWLELVSNGIYGKVFPEDAPIPDDVATFEECTDWAEGEADIDDPEEFCGFYHIPEEELVAGDWIQTWRVHDDDLYELIEEDIIAGFSIGARDVSWRGPMDGAELPEGVGVPPELDADEDEFWEITDGVIREVSVVDIPAVPDAQILAKDDADKRLGDYLGDREGFMAEAQERGHDEAAAEMLWDVLNRANQVEGADAPGKSILERAGKAFLGALKGGDGGSDDAPVAETQTRVDETAKEGRTLSRQNRESLFATIDASLDVLEDAGVNHGMDRFTDRDEWAFDLTEHSARSWPDDESEQTADTDTQTMTDTDDSTDTDDGKTASDDAPEWAESLQSQVEQNAERIEDVLEADADTDADADADGDTGKDADADDGGDEPPEWAKSLTEQVEANAEAIEQIGKQSGRSTQLSGNGTGEGDEDEKESLASLLRKAGV